MKWKISFEKNVQDRFNGFFNFSKTFIQIMGFKNVRSFTPVYSAFLALLSMALSALLCL